MTPFTVTCWAVLLTASLKVPVADRAPIASDGTVRSMRPAIPAEVSTRPPLRSTVPSGPKSAEALARVRETTFAVPVPLWLNVTSAEIAKPPTATEMLLPVMVRLGVVSRLTLRSPLTDTPGTVTATLPEMVPDRPADVMVTSPCPLERVTKFVDPLPIPALTLLKATVVVVPSLVIATSPENCCPAMVTMMPVPVTAR